MSSFGHHVMRYRPLVLAVVAALLLVLAPDRGGSSGSASVTAGGPDLSGPSATGGGATGTDASTPDGAAASGASVSTGPSATGPSAAVGPGGAAATAGAAGEAGTRAAGEYPGVGTPEALANPNCDPNTGKIKFPSLWAPACVRPWPAGANNGGATSEGVTDDAIRIVVMLNPDDGSDTAANDEDFRRQVLDSLNIWESHYELWGRKLDVRFYKATGDDEVAQRADAIEAFNRHKPFMAWSLTYGGTAPRVWSIELAARGVITMDSDVFWSDHQAQAPYRWSGNIDDRLHSLMIAEWVGKRLVGRPAQWAGDPTYKPQTRAFGLLYPDAWDRSIFDGEAARNGLKLTDAIAYPQGATVPEKQSLARTHIARLKNKDVTSIIAATDPIYTALLTTEATTQRYNPEWVITGWATQDVVVLGRLYDQQQWRNAFGVGPIQPLPPLELEERTQLHQWHHGRPPDQAAIHGMTYLHSRDVMAALQLAGPTLTPETFRDAMFGKQPVGGVWCDCKASTSTSYGRALGLPWDDYSGYDDFDEKWWDPSATGNDELGVPGPGMYAHVNSGKRYAFGQFATGEPAMFDPSGAVNAFDEVPPEDRWPEYEHQPHE